VGQSWWNCEDDVWGRVGGIVKRMCGGGLVELLCRCVGAGSSECDTDVWGRVGGIVKTMCGAELVEL
jgi:hypothetical protein